MSHMYNLAIIGAGPAGIATAVESYLQGIRDIVLLEKDQNHNSTIRKYYKDNKSNICCLHLDFLKDKLIKEGKMEKGGSFGGTFDEE